MLAFGAAGPVPVVACIAGFVTGNSDGDRCPAHSSPRHAISASTAQCCVISQPGTAPSTESSRLISPQQSRDVVEVSQPAVITDHTVRRATGPSPPSATPHVPIYIQQLALLI
jgi:hypothetical protein